jgi:hypothetical protein
MMADATPNVKLDWANGDIPMADDFNRIEWNILSVWQHNKYADEAGSVATANYSLMSATANYALQCATANYALACAGGGGGGGDAVLGTSNASVNYWHSYQVQIDTRSFILAYDINGNLVQVKSVDPTDNSTIYETVDITYQDTVPIEFLEITPQKKVHWKLQWQDGNLIRIDKEIEDIGGEEQ